MYKDKGERKIHAIQAAMERRTMHSRVWWAGFHWPTVKGDIATAEAKLEEETAPSLYERYAPWDIHRDVLLEYGDGNGKRRDVTELLAELQKLG